jgi:hypothetical protein
MTEYFSTAELLAKIYCKHTRLAFDGSNNLIYLGVNRKPNSSGSDENWMIKKFTWSGVNLVRIQGPLEGAWDDRTSLGW